MLKKPQLRFHSLGLLTYSSTLRGFAPSVAFSNILLILPMCLVCLRLYFFEHVKGFSPAS